jgi:hypothetical protein
MPSPRSAQAAGQAGQSIPGRSTVIRPRRLPQGCSWCPESAPMPEGPRFARPTARGNGRGSQRKRGVELVLAGEQGLKQTSVAINFGDHLHVANRFLTIVRHSLARGRLVLRPPPCFPLCLDNLALRKRGFFLSARYSPLSEFGLYPFGPIGLDRCHRANPHRRRSRRSAARSLRPSADRPCQTERFWPSCARRRAGSA